MKFNEAIEKIMPLVDDYDESTPFIIHHKTSETHGDWFVTYPYPAENADKILAKCRENDPFCDVHKGSDFSRGSFPYVYDKVLAHRLRAEHDECTRDERYSDADKRRLDALINFVEDNIAGFSHVATDFLTELEKPFIHIHWLCPFDLATDREDWDYKENLAEQTIEQIESKIADIISRPKDVQEVQKTASLRDAISEIMPLIQDDNSDKPFIITRDSAYGDWQICYPPPENAKSFFASQKELDPFAIMLAGSNFPEKSFEAVCDRVLYTRIRLEYYLEPNSGEKSDELNAMTCFIKDHIGDFSDKAKDYLATLDRPLAELDEMCPFSMDTEYSDWTYNEDLAFEAVERIENEICDRLHSYPDERVVEARFIGGYEVKHSVTIGKIDVVLGENLNSAEPYLVCNIAGKDESNRSAYTGYVQALGEFLSRQTELFSAIKAEREQRDDVTLTAAECLPGSDREDFTGKLIIVKSSELLPEYRYADSQLVECTHGNGACPDAIGTSVFGTELYSGASVVYGRHQILGLADPEKLPEWAKTKHERNVRIAANKAWREYGDAIDEAIKSGVEGKNVPLTLKILDARFGREKTDELLATIALTSLKDDGRISRSGIEWAKSILGDTSGLKTLSVSAHPAHFDNLLMYAERRGQKEQEKPDILAKIGKHKEKSEQTKTAPKKHKRNDPEVN